MFNSNYTEHIIKIQKENAFTFVRILCSLIVLYEHSIILMDLKFPILNIRNIAVNVFFILSGFWITKSLYTSKSLLEFYKKRIRKIFPAYLTIVFATAILLVFMSKLTVREYFTDSGFYKYLAANISTLNFIHPTLPGVFNGEPVNGSLWTIKIELGFYIIIPLIAFICIGKKNIGGGVQMCSYTCTDISSFGSLYNFNAIGGRTLSSSYKHYQSTSGLYDLFYSRNGVFLLLQKSTFSVELFNYTFNSIDGDLLNSQK